MGQIGYRSKPGFHKKWQRTAAVLFSAASFLLICGCSNIIEPSRDYIVKDQGILRLEVGSEARTIMPDPGSYGFYDILELYFYRDGQDKPAIHDTWDGNGSYQIALSDGSWRLEASAMLDGKKTAGGTQFFQVEHGTPVSVTVILKPVFDSGSGSFRLEVSNAAILASCRISVTDLDGGPLKPEINEVLSPGQSINWSHEMEAGQYTAKLTLSYKNGEEKTLSQILHVYSNLESVWRWYAENVNSGMESLFAAWNGSAWTFQALGIKTWHLIHFDNLYSGNADLYDGFGSPLLADMDIGEIDSLFTAISNSADGPLPPAGKYGSARFKMLIDAALVSRAVSLGSLVPDSMSSQEEVENAFNGLTAGLGNGTEIEFCWKDWADGAYQNPVTDDLRLLVGSPKYKASAKITHKAGEVAIEGPASVMRDSAKESRWLFAAKNPAFPSYTERFVWSVQAAKGIRLETAGSGGANGNTGNGITLVVEPEAQIPQEVILKTDWQNPDGSIKNSAEMTVRVSAEASQLVLSPPSDTLAIYADKTVRIKAEGKNLGPTRTVSFADSGVMPPAGKMPHMLPEGVRASGEMQIIDGTGTGEIILSGIPALTSGRKREVPVTLSLESLGIAGNAQAILYLDIAGPPPAAVTKTQPASITIIQGNNASVDFETENITTQVNGWDFISDIPVSGLPARVTVDPASRFSSSTQTGKGSGRLTINADRIPPGETGKPFTVRVQFPGVSGSFTLNVTPGVFDSVEVNPGIVEGAVRGQSVQFTATVKGSGWEDDKIPQDVIWSVSGNGSGGTTISDGLLKIAANEPGQNLTVRATSKYDKSIYGEAKISLKQAVTGIEVSQKNTSMAGGNIAVKTAAVFTAAVTGSGNPPQFLHPLTSINSGGVLTASSGETMPAFTVRATPVADSPGSPEATANINLTGEILVGDWKIVRIGVYHTMGIRHDGSLWTWGRNTYGQLGTGYSGDRSRPEEVQHGSKDWAGVSGGWSHTVALKTDGTLWAWGRIYDSPHDTSPAGLVVDYGAVPRQVGTGSDWAYISAGYNNAFAIKDDGTLWAWGNNSYGKLGTGDRESSNTPVKVGSDNDWLLVSSGQGNSIAVKRNGTLWTWGRSGRVPGTETGYDQLRPLQIAAETRWKSAAIGNGFATAIDNDGYLWTWGDGSNGALGNGSTGRTGTPARMEGSREWLAVSNHASGHVVAIDSTGTLFTWGSNSYCQIGDGTNVNKNRPVEIRAGVGPNKWMGVAASGSFSLAIQRSGSLWAWGHNEYGQLGNGNPVMSVKIPVQIMVN